MKTRRVVYLAGLSMLFIACIFSCVFAEVSRSTSTGTVSRMLSPQIKVPDLIVESIKVPGQLKEGDKVENIVVKIKNKGTASVSPCKLKISCKPAGPLKVHVSIRTYVEEKYFTAPEHFASFTDLNHIKEPEVIAIGGQLVYIPDVFLMLELFSFGQKFIDH